MQRSKGSGGEQAIRREAAEAEAHELARGTRRAKGRAVTIGVKGLPPITTNWVTSEAMEYL